MGWLDRFEMAERGTTVGTELLAGVTTFASMAYILFVNPHILAAAGMDEHAVLIATALAAGVGSILMGLIANLPFAMAPGMGMNAYFAYTVCLDMKIPWQTALAAVFLDGVIFLILSLLPIRSRLIAEIPFNIKLATAAAIGLFIALIGMQNIGLVAADPATMLTAGKLTPAVLLALGGLWLMAALLQRKTHSAFLLGILAVALVSFFVPEKPGGPMITTLSEFQWPHPADITRGFGKLDFGGAEKLGLAMIVFTFTFVSLFDTAGTFVGLALRLGWIDKDKPIFEGAGRGLLAESFAIMFGALAGTSTNATYIESASGIAQGGRTGLTAISTGILFLLSVFLAPVMGLIPKQATGPVMILVGLLMLEPLLKLELDDYTESVPAFMALIVVPFTFSIANGLICGIVSYAVLKVITGRVREITPTMWILTILCLISATRLE
jgi:adenine/guanine/hypoxanthine permease